MNDGYQWWLLILGMGVGAGILWLLIGRLPRGEEDVGSEERAAEAAWISRSIVAAGGAAPEELVDQILELHRAYLDIGEPEVSTDPAAIDTSLVRRPPQSELTRSTRATSTGSGGRERPREAAEVEAPPTR